MSTIRRMPWPRDAQRSRVYNAEQKPLPDFSTFVEVEAFVSGVTQSRFWTALLRQLPVRHRDAAHRLRVDERAHPRAVARGWRDPRAGWSTIVLPSWAWSQLVILHELAHIATPNEVPSHGAHFCANYLVLVKRFIGRSTFDWLKARFVDGRVRYRRPRQSRTTIRRVST